MSTQKTARMGCVDYRVALLASAYGTHRCDGRRLLRSTKGRQLTSGPALPWAYQDGQHRAVLGVELEDGLAIAEAIEI